MRKRTIIAEIDRDEVALIIAETCIGLCRPPGRSATSLLAEMEREQPKIIRDIKLAALRVLQHVQEKVALASTKGSPMSEPIMPRGEEDGRGPSDPGHSCSAPSPQAVSASGESPSRTALFQKAMRFIDFIAGDGEVEVTTDEGERLASVNLCGEFAALHGCEIWDEAYSIALGYPLPPAPAIEARSAETQSGSVEDESAITEGEAPIHTPTPQETAHVED